jgi:hypothetical protein
VIEQSRHGLHGRQVLAGQQAFHIYGRAKRAVGEAAAQAFGPFLDLVLADHDQGAILHLRLDPLEPWPVQRLAPLHLFQQGGRVLQLPPGQRLAEQFLAFLAREIVAANSSANTFGCQSVRIFFHLYEDEFTPSPVALIRH